MTIHNSLDEWFYAIMDKDKVEHCYIFGSIQGPIELCVVMKFCLRLVVQPT